MTTIAAIFEAAHIACSYAIARRNGRFISFCALLSFCRVLRADGYRSPASFFFQLRVFIYRRIQPERDLPAGGE
ncbi:hypothetical protein KCP76_08815 [Salmonella enterica subsp. enterica serovar Weltevreden]|nr:hypothetical protein KCP76_08815 [Salmonella enterica subsp. enterica serovar Weltevreden]